MFALHLKQTRSNKQVQKRPFPFFKKNQEVYFHADAMQFI
jgi:hypothetical protein